MWPNLSGMTPVKVLSSGVKLKSEKISSVVPLGSVNAIASPMPGVMSLRRSLLTPAFFSRDDSLAEIAARRDLERQPRRFDGAAALQHDRLQAGFGREDGAVLLARQRG